MSNLVEWSKKELDRLGNDEMQRMMNKNIIEIVEVFSEQGHSGFTASYAINMIQRLLNWKPIMSLTGEDDEWNKIDDNYYQNKRCSAVFKTSEDNSTAYYIDGKIFSDDNGETWYTCRESRIPVSFPFDVPEKPERIILK